jgi:hypothetical protein
MHTFAFRPFEFVHKKILGKGWLLLNSLRFISKVKSLLQMHKHMRLQVH